MADGLRILLVEDNDGDAVLVEEYLKAGAQGRGRFQLHRAKTLAQGQRAFAEFRPHVVLLDLNLPDSKGIETLEAFCRVPERTRPPIVVMTSLDDQELAEQAIADCAQDYLVKDDVNPRVLVRAIRFAIQRHGEAEVDKMYADEEGTSAVVAADQQQALGILHRINLTGPGSGPIDDSAELGDPMGGALLMEHFAAGSKATEAVVTRLDRRLRQLEDNKHKQDVSSARRELLWARLERLLDGNGKGPLATRLEAVERSLLDLSDARGRGDRPARASALVALVLAGLALLAAVGLLARALGPS